jgi:hypothetical protein
MMGRIGAIVGLKPRLRRLDQTAHRRAATDTGLDNDCEGCSKAAMKHGGLDPEL